MPKDLTVTALAMWGLFAPQWDRLGLGRTLALLSKFNPSVCLFLGKSAIIGKTDIELNIFTDQIIRDVFFKANRKPNLALVTGGGTYTDGSGRTEHDNINVNDNNNK